MQQAVADEQGRPDVAVDANHAAPVPFLGGQGYQELDREDRFAGASGGRDDGVDSHAGFDLSDGWGSCGSGNVVLW
jgi:hypothetical protein